MPKKVLVLRVKENSMEDVWEEYKKLRNLTFSSAEEEEKCKMIFLDGVKHSLNEILKIFESLDKMAGSELQDLSEMMKFKGDLLPS